jgi:hypothetical protein
MLIIHEDVVTDDNAVPQQEENVVIRWIRLRAELQEVIE